MDFDESKLVALTFDDGPSFSTTPRILDILERYHIPATFFLVGEWIEDEKKCIMDRQLKLGCELANHSWSHSHMTEMSADEIAKEITDTNHRIEKMVGVTPYFFRPPFIDINETMKEIINMPFICGINCLDWEPEVDAIEREKRIINRVKSGDIILMHDFEGNTATVKAVENLVPELMKQGYEFVTLSQIFELTKTDPFQKNMIWSNVFQSVM